MKVFLSWSGEKSTLREAPSKKLPSKSQKEISDEILLNTREIMKLVAESHTNRNKPAISMMYTVNRNVTRLYREVGAENYPEVQKQVYLLGKKLVDLNAMVGKTSGGSLTDLKAWTQKEPAVEENDASDEENVPTPTRIVRRPARKAPPAISESS